MDFGKTREKNVGALYNKKMLDLQCYNHDAKPTGDENTGKCYLDEFFVFL
jgi:hypothetical protein